MARWLQTLARRDAEIAELSPPKTLRRITYETGVKAGKWPHAAERFDPARAIGLCVGLQSSSRHLESPQAGGDEPRTAYVGADCVSARPYGGIDIS